MPDRAAEDVATTDGDAETGESTAAPTAEPEPTAEPTAAPDMPSAEEAGVIAPEDIAVDAGAPAPDGEGGTPEWLAQVIEGIAPNPDTGQAGCRLTFC